MKCVDDRVEFDVSIQCLSSLYVLFFKEALSLKLFYFSFEPPLPKKKQHFGYIFMCQLKYMCFYSFFSVGQPLMSEISDSLSTFSICIQQLLAPCLCHRECNINQYCQLLQSLKKESWPPRFTAQKNNIRKNNNTKLNKV